MKNLIEILVKALVDDPDAVSVDEMDEGDAVTYTVSVAEDDIGKVIGKQGRIAKAIRTVMRAAATRKGEKVSVEID